MTMTESSSFGNNKKRMTDHFIQNKIAIDYKDVDTLRKFLSQEGKILPSRRTGLTAANQRDLTKAIKRARQAGLLPFRYIDA